MSVFEISTSLKIKSSPERVKALLLDFDSYPSWSKFLKVVKVATLGPSPQSDGFHFDPPVGSLLHIEILPPNGREMSFDSVVSQNDASIFSWKGKLFAEFLFVGIHEFEIKEIDDGVEFFQREKFNGVLTYVLRSLLSKTEDGFKEFNEALKAKAESIS